MAYVILYSLDKCILKKQIILIYIHDIVFLKLNIQLTPNNKIHFIEYFDIIKLKNYYFNNQRRIFMKTLKKTFYAVLIAFMAIILIYPMPANAAKKKTVFIAAGHQKRGISSTEPLAPGSKQRKAKLTSGTQGVKTKIPEYKTNLAIAKATKTELQKRGYKVIMLRTTNDCSLSNKQRTQKANKSGADIHICIHCNSSTSKKSVGPLAIVPSSSKYVGKTVYTKSRSLGKSIVSGVSKSTGKKACSTIYSDYYTTLNYAKIPTFILECGFMSNPTEDVQLNSASYQKKLAKGIANGVDAYFKTNK